MTANVISRFSALDNHYQTNYGLPKMKSKNPYSSLGDEANRTKSHTALGYDIHNNAKVI